MPNLDAFLIKLRRKAEASQLVSSDSESLLDSLGQSYDLRHSSYYEFAWPMTHAWDEVHPFITGNRECTSEPDALEGIHLSNELGRAGNFDEALAVLDTAIQQGNPNPYLYYNAGNWLSL